MLGLILLYFIWKNYSELAAKYGKHKVGFALLGIATYYAGTFLAGLIIGIVASFSGSSLVEESNNWTLGLMALPFGILSVWALYKILERRWKAEVNGIGSSNSESLDADLLSSGSKDQPISDKN